ncbi:MAG: tetratricopeptide repeat protein [Chloroflexi bacterium]|nr:tetratricopeptide repeat protein [Chloroflexota bacterium]
MESQINQLHELVAAREVKKAEVVIARLLRSELPPEQRTELLILRARTRLLAGRPADALHDLAEIKAVAPSLLSEPSLLELQAESYLTQFEVAAVGFAQKSDVREASRIYQSLIDHHPDYENIGWIYYQQGRVALIEDQPFAAESYFHKALFAASTVVALTAYCYERLGFMAYYESRQPRQALVYLNKAIDTYPASASPLWLVQVYLLRSRVLRESSLEDALQSAKTAYKLAAEFPANKALAAEALFSVAEILAQQAGREQEIVDYLQRFMQTSKPPLGVDVTWSRAYEMLGDSYSTLGQYEQAAAAYENALQCNPYHPWAESLHYRMGRALYQQQKYADAIAALNRVVAETSDYRIYSLLGNALFAIGHYAEAASAYETGIRMAPPGADTQSMQTYYEFSQQMNPPL